MSRIGPGVESAIEAVQALLQRAEQSRTSDVHIHRVGGEYVVDFRLDGLLSRASSHPLELGERMIGRLKYLARLKTYQDHLPQEGRICGREAGVASDIRLATYPTINGEKAVLRMLHERSTPGLKDLGFPPVALAVLERFLGGPSGLLLLTGPAGSGKSTTIYACIQHLAALGGRHIVTVEDPVERVIPGVMQTEVNEAAGLTFGKAARHLLRLDPQVFVLGEIRDDETADILVRAALTGHLVIATLHAGSCSGVFDRLCSLASETRSAISAVDLVLNQRLLRLVCNSCKGAGCASCEGTGYRGRVPAVEWVRVTQSVRHDFLTGGMAAVKPEISLEAAVADLVSRGLTTSSESIRVLGRPGGNENP